MENIARGELYIIHDLRYVEISLVELERRGSQARHAHAQ